MSISKKGRRKIVVNNTVFFWKIRRDPTYSQLMGSPHYIAITHEKESGKSLIVLLPYGRPDSMMSASIKVLPAMVKEYILLALEKGWNYEEKGPYFFLKIEQDQIPKASVIPYILKKDPDADIGFRF